MKRMKYSTLDFSLNVGEVGDDQQADLYEGTCVGVKVILFNQTERNHTIKIGIDDNGGSSILDRTDFRDYQVSGGGYLGSFKPCAFTDRKPKVAVQSSQPIADTTFEGQIIFAIEQEIES